MNALEASAWGQNHPTVVATWRRAWERVIPFFAFVPEIRRAICTTNAVESLNSQLRKIIKTRWYFPSNDAASKLLWLVIGDITADWTRSELEWRQAMNQFAIAHGDRFTNLN